MSTCSGQATEDEKHVEQSWVALHQSKQLRAVTTRYPPPRQWGQPRSVELPHRSPADSRHVNSTYLTHVPVKVKVLVSQSYPWTVAHQVSLPIAFPGKNTGMSCHSLLQGIFLIQGSNLGLLHLRQILYCLRHQGSPCASKPLWLFVTEIYFSKR